jgi:hypothetical protein
MTRRFGALLLSFVATVALPSRIAAQAFTAPAGVGAMSVGWQYVDNTGHRFSDGFLLARGQSVTMAMFFDLEYGITDRFSASAGIPYVFAKYTGAMPPPSGLRVDACACWHSSFQDLSVGARYRFGDDTWAITPLARYTLPTHNYRFEGEAVVGRDLHETQVGVDAGLRLHGLLHNASLQTGYEYAFVERPLRDVSVNRSNAFFEVGYALTNRLFVRGITEWQETHGGLRIGSPTGHPFFPPGELNTPQRFAQRDRVLSTQYWHAGGGITYSAGPADIFVAVTKYINGRNTHNGQVYTVGSTWYFDRSRF